MVPDKNSIFSINDRHGFVAKALKVFYYQYHGNAVYREFCDHLKVNPKKVSDLGDIPFLPIEFFKSRKVLVGNHKPQTIFTSSGTTGQITSKHCVTDLSLYERSFLKGFELFYGPIKEYCILALLPSYLERQGSSLVYMVDALIKKTENAQSGFYLNNLEDLLHQLTILEASGEKVLLIGVSFALLDLAELINFPLANTIVMETGGMKGRRKEMIRIELHHILKSAFGVEKIHSEYGMTELLSQAYSQGNGIFNCPPWMKVQIRDTEDPLSTQNHGKTGGINVIDLANLHSCSFIATQDLGKVYSDDSFEVLGRFDHADVRGCNLMVM
jgi:phenylacetate-coenzyme A ligase PaaK-like adenylate-forming protein